MVILDKKWSLTEFRGTLFLYTRRFKDLLEFFHLKNKTFFYCEKIEKNICWFKKNFQMIDTGKNIQQLVNLDILILNHVNRQTKQLMVKILAKLPKLKKIIVLENKKNYLNSNFSGKFLFQVNLEIFLKKKFVQTKNLTTNLSGYKNIFIIFRRKNVPKFCNSEFKNLVKFFSYYANKRLGSIVKNKSFFFTINSFYHFKAIYNTENIFLKNNFEENLQRITEELGLISNKIISFKPKDFFYIMGYFKT